MPPASGWRTPSAAKVMASGADSASSADPRQDGGGTGGLGGQRGEDQDAGAEDGADVEGGGRAGGEHAGSVPRNRGHVVLTCAPADGRVRNDLPPDDPIEEPIMPLDSVDRRMLEILQREGRISNAALAEQLHLSPSPCLRRLRALETRRRHLRLPRRARPRASSGSA